MKHLDTSQYRPRIAIVAGEPSGDELGGELMAALKAYLPHAEFFGVGGEKMSAQGIKSLFPMEKLSVRGYVEVIKHLPEILRIRRMLKAHILKEKPDVYIGIDAPDFNLGLEKIFKEAGIPTVHYVGPTVWMWRKNRIEKIRQAVSHLLLIFPFEKAIWDKANVPATYVGHSLADTIPLETQKVQSREKLSIAQDVPVVALLPGSRFSELEYLSTLLIDSAKALHKRYQNMVFLVPLATAKTYDYFQQEVKNQQAQHLPIKIMLGHAHDVMQAADVVVLASGTATLEVMLTKKPMVIVYKLNALTYLLIKKKFYLPYFGLPNILSQDFVVPELIQNEAKVENVVQAVENYLSDHEACQNLAEHFTAIHHQLRCNAKDQAAIAVLKVMGYQL